MRDQYNISLLLSYITVDDERKGCFKVERNLKCLQMCYFMPYVDTSVISKYRRNISVRQRLDLSWESNSVIAAYFEGAPPPPRALREMLQE